MTRPGSKRNMGASVRGRLLKLSRERQVAFQDVVDDYLRERFLYRLAQSTARDTFILKGASLFTLWGLNHRQTRDIDFLGRGTPSVDHLRMLFEDILSVPLEQDDGVIFEATALMVEERREDKEYRGALLLFI